MWQYINKNPQGRSVGDCTVRAISTATGNGWMETYLDLCLFGLLMADMPSANSVTTAYLRNKGFRRRTIPDDCPDCYTIADFCRDHPKGTYIIGTGSHLTTVIDGDFYKSIDYIFWVDGFTLAEQIAIIRKYKPDFKMKGCNL